MKKKRKNVKVLIENYIWSFTVRGSET